MHTRLLLIHLLTIAVLFAATFARGAVSYPVVGTGQTQCYDDRGEIDPPQPGQPYDGQDAQYRGLQPRYQDNSNGTVTDLNTGLMWQKGYDQGRKQTFTEAKAGAGACRDRRLHGLAAAHHQGALFAD